MNLVKRFRRPLPSVVIGLLFLVVQRIFRPRLMV
jgi:hypothetical protein